MIKDQQHDRGASWDWAHLTKCLRAQSYLRRGENVRELTMLDASNTYKFCFFLFLTCITSDITSLETFCAVFSMKYRIANQYTSFSISLFLSSRCNNMGRVDNPDSMIYHTLHFVALWSHLKAHSFKVLS